MRPGDGSGANAAPSVFATYRTLLGPGVPLQSWIASASMPPAANRTSPCASPPGDDRFYANILLTVGYIPPSS